MKITCNLRLKISLEGRYIKVSDWGGPTVLILKPSHFFILDFANIMYFYCHLLRLVIHKENFSPINKSNEKFALKIQSVCI